jgi:recombination protein RecR
MQDLIHEFQKLPGIGEKTAFRLVLHLLKVDRASALTLAEGIVTLRHSVGLCKICFSLAEGDVCEICLDPTRDKAVVCAVEEAGDQVAVERSGVYRGLYHVLQGALSPIDGMGPECLRVGELMHRLKSDEIRELILATNTTVEGEATAHYLAQAVKPLGIRVTRIAHGLPMGGDVEYADVATLGKALDGRREI